MTDIQREFQQDQREARRAELAGQYVERLRQLGYEVVSEQDERPWLLKFWILAASLTIFCALAFTVLWLLLRK